MTVKEFLKQPIEEIIKHPYLISVTKVGNPVPMYWEIRMKADGLDKVGTYHFLGIRGTHSVFIMYKPIDNG